MTDDSKQEIINAYKEIVKKEKALPSAYSFVEYGISRDKIGREFGSMDNLHEIIRDTESDFLNEHFLTVDSAFSENKNITNTNKKKFIITTAVAGTKANKPFLDSLTNYCNKHNAQIVIMPAESVTNSFEKKTAVFDTEFNNPKYLFVQDNTPLNNNLYLCSIQVSAKQIKPITGLSRLGNREGSYIFASPKQFLEYIPSGNKRGKNYSIMTTGACTLPEYYSETFVSKRLSYIADHDHTMGAIVVEIEDDTYFHFRQIQCDDTGSFIDLSVKYNPDGSTENVPVNVVFGDLHGVNADKEAINTFIDFLKPFKIEDIFLHDIFDGYSISHHIQTIAEKSMRSNEGYSSLTKELQETFDLVDNIDRELNPAQVNIVKSNHDEFLDRYLKEGRYIFDSENHYVSLKIATALFEDFDVLAKGFSVVGKDVPFNWNFLQRDSSYDINGVECGSHGDLGLNGAKPSLNSLEKIYGDCVVGHNHTAAIQRGVFRVGTLSKLDMRYNRGPSSWTQTCCLIYDNGQRQLINIVNGKCAA